MKAAGGAAIGAATGAPSEAAAAEANGSIGRTAHAAVHTQTKTTSFYLEKQRFSDTLFGKLAKNPRFEHVCIFVILLNAIEVGWDADYGARWVRPDSVWQGPMQFRVTAIFFSCFFTMEMFIRLVAYRVWWRCVSDTWFIFDSALVLLMLVENFVLPFLGASGPLGHLSVLRLLRLLRIARVAKLMKVFPPLLLIVRGMFRALKANVWSLILMLLVTVTTAIIFTSTYHQGSETDEKAVETGDTIHIYFGSLEKSIVSLFIMGTILDDVTACCDAIRDTENLWMLACFIGYVLLDSFILLNMQTGILVEVVGSTNAEHKARALECEVTDSVTRIFLELDSDGNGRITKAEFSAMKQDKMVMANLHKLGIKEKHFDKLVELLMQRKAALGQEEAIDFQEMLESIMRLRPGTSFSALELAAFHHVLISGLLSIRDHVVQIESLVALALSAAEGGGSPSGIASTVSAAPSAGGESEEPYGGSPAWPCLSVVGFQPRPISSDMLDHVETTCSREIVHELQRRLGVPDLETTGVPYWMMDDELQGLLEVTDAGGRICGTISNTSNDESRSLCAEVPGQCIDEGRR